MMRKILATVICLMVFCVWQYVFMRVDGGLTIDGFFMSVFCTLCLLVLFFALKGVKWRIDNGVDLFAKLETNPEVVKERMLFIMQYRHSDGIKGALKEFNDIFRNYPQWEFQNWEVFRAWYKHLIDHAIEKPEIYNMRFKDGSEYCKEKDPLYDPDAPDWEQFDRSYHYGDDEEYDDDDDDDETPGLQKAAEDGFYMGIGMGAADNILHK